MLVLYSTTVPSSGALMTGFSSQFSKGSEITFSVPSQTVTLLPGDYMI